MSGTLAALKANSRISLPFHSVFCENPFALSLGAIVRLGIANRDRGPAAGHLVPDCRDKAMSDSGVDQILRAIENVEGLSRRLVLLVGPPSSGKTGALRAVAEQIGAPRINLNLELSRRLMDPTAPHRAIPTLGYSR